MADADAIPMPSDRDEGEYPSQASVEGDQNPPLPRDSTTQPAAPPTTESSFLLPRPPQPPPAGPPFPGIALPPRPGPPPSYHSLMQHHPPPFGSSLMGFPLPPRPLPPGPHPDHHPMMQQQHSMPSPYAGPHRPPPPHSSQPPLHHQGLPQGMPPAGMSYPPSFPPRGPPPPSPQYPPHQHHHTMAPFPGPPHPGMGQPADPGVDTATMMRLAASMTSGLEPGEKYDNCWKCGKKNPMPNGMCAKCAGFQPQHGGARGGAASRQFHPYGNDARGRPSSQQRFRGRAVKDGEADPMDPEAYGQVELGSVNAGLGEAD